MSSNQSYLALCLVSPLQSWGFDSQYNRRNTALMPTKSGIAGMCCAALVYSRGNEKERVFLEKFRNLKMTAIVIPRKLNKELAVRRMQDYHTVQHTRRASGTINKDCVLTYRQYLNDAAFGIVLEGDTSLLGKIADAFKNPVWGIWLGRKTCIPSAPVLAGLEANKANALHHLIGEVPIESFTRQEDVEQFSDGHDSIPDVPVSFATERRGFSPRRVRTLHGSE